MRHRTAKVFLAVCVVAVALCSFGAAFAYQTCVTQTVTDSYSFVSLGTIALTASQAGQPAALSPSSAVANDIKAVFSLPEGENLPVYIFVELIPGNGAQPSLWKTSPDDPNAYFAVRSEDDGTPVIAFSVDDAWKPVEGAPNVFFVETDKTDEFNIIKDRQIKAGSGLSADDDVSRPSYSIAFKAFAVEKTGFASPKAAWDALKSQTEVSGQ